MSHTKLHNSAPQQITTDYNGAPHFEPLYSQKNYRTIIMRKVEFQKKYKVPIHELYSIVHEAKDQGISTLSTLRKYGVTSRAYYTQCKKHGLKNWSELKPECIMVRKSTPKKENGLSGGSLPPLKIDKKEKERRFTFTDPKIEALKKKSRDLDIKNGRIT